jgi:hypothetical protein
VSEQEIDFLLAQDYELTRSDDRSIGRAVRFCAGGGMKQHSRLAFPGERMKQCRWREVA